jgi:flagellin-like protein
MKFKKRWLDNKGVSEIIGTILTLAITVVLFASIMAFVTNMPAPIDRPTVDFLSSLSIAAGSGTVTLTHNGGEALNDYETQILVIKDNVVLTTPRTMAQGGLGSTWKIGQKWTATINPLTATNSLEIMIVDTHSNSQIWSGKIGTGVGNNFPAILQRWTDSDPSTTTVDPIIEGDSYFWLFVRVTDLDKDIQSVTVDASSIGSSSSKTNDNLIEGVYGFNFTTPITQASLFDGRPLFIIAKDTANHWTNATFILSVSASERGPQGEKGDSGDDGTSYPGNSSWPEWLEFYNSGQAYVILGENESARPPMGASADVDDAKTTFVQGDEWIFIRVGSLTMKDVDGKNSLKITNPISGETVSPPSSESAFYRIPYGGTGYLYEAKFNSSLLNPGSYQLTVDLLSTSTSGQPPAPVRFYTTTSIIITPKSGDVGFFTPAISTWDKNRRVDPTAQYWGNASDKPYVVTSITTCFVWVEVKVQTIDPLSSVYIDNVEITDMRARTNLYGSAPSGDGMIGSVGADSANKTYYFQIDLRLRNGNSWTPGLASYSLSVIKLLDADEGLYTVIKPIWVLATADYYDYIVVTDGFKKKDSPTCDYAFQIDNNQFFTSRVIDGAEEDVGEEGSAASVYLSEYFDIDGDGDRDVLAALNVNTDKKHHKLQPGDHIVMYFNQLEEFGEWSTAIEFENYTDNSKALLSLAFGDVDNDGDMDWMSSNANGDVHLYISDWPIVTKKILTGKYFLKMKLADINGDKRADLIAMGGTADNVKVGDANCKLYFYNLTRGGAIAATPVDFNPLPPGNGNLMDFSVADIDNDGDIDVAVCADTTESGAGIRWHRNTPTYTTPGAQATADPGSYIGQRTSGTFASTQTSDDSYEAIREVGGDLDYIWPVGTVSGSNPTLYFEGRVSSGADEGFYVFYGKTVTGPWIFVAYMSNTVDQTFTYPLMPGTTGTIYVRVIDASILGTVDDTIYVDRINVRGILSVSYANINPLGAGNTDFVAIDIGNMNSVGNLDIAVGKACADMVGGVFKVINGDTGAALSTTNYAALYPGLRTFLVRDVNGDGRSDILSVCQTYIIKDPKKPTQLTYVNTVLCEWLNLGSGTSFYNIEISDFTLSSGGKGGKPGKVQAINQFNCEMPYF